MSIDLTLCAKRVTQILNAAARDGSGNSTFVTTVEDARRNATNISTAVDEACLKVAEAYCQGPDPQRAPFVSYVTVTHGTPLTGRAWLAGLPQIQPYAGADWIAGVKGATDEIESYRENPSNIYDGVAHDEEGSILSGLFDLVGGVPYFTGYAARFPLASFTTAADAASKLPAEAEAVVVRVAVGLVKTEGDSQTLDAYGMQGAADLASIKAGGMPAGNAQAA